ncbi:L-dopachrome tautomerase-related protein [Sphingomonas immobilis]|uniref:L-dopachrome tautomerase-related protein n=1 Tax=Sphingomonas immobilis TaxID=3063997 RepID=A0ABT8ZY59_9SPHN|nr:L-dopachrome tautomerase-related protein [Sphingomonas sp. CA1-15]MDO7842499.1 L-dopachrome tautomerase-related protein [Sphingomonas sp. CA1-15]
MENDDTLTRRQALTGLAIGAAGAATLPAAAVQAQAAASPLTVAARSPWLVNAVAVNDGGTMFLGLPRFGAAVETPSLARVEKDGSLTPFPGGAWNGWKPGNDGRDAFVMVNAIHIFDDNTLWIVDQGAPSGSKPAPGAQKLVRLDSRNGSLLTVLRFGDDILPPGAQLNDLRIHDQMLYVTDSGLGGIIVHDLTTNQTLRRLSGHAMTTATAAPLKGKGGRILADARGKRPNVQSDGIELSVDGLWLYWATPTGPFRRISTAALADTRLSDEQLGRLVETIAEIPTIGGNAIDTLGNLYLSDCETRRITVATPGGARAMLVADDRLSSPDAIFIDKNRRLYLPASQIESLAQHAGGTDQTRAPFLVLTMMLPESLAGHPLGDAVTGRPPATGLSNFHGIEHVAMTVPDFEAAIRFFQDAFDATVLYRHIKASDPPVTYEQVGKINGLAPGTRMLRACQLRFANGPNIELFQLEGYGRRESAGINDMGLVHFSVVVEDIRAAGARFIKAGGTMLEGPFDLGLNEVGPGNQNWFGQTPWGTWIEFMTFRSPLRYDPGAVAERWFPQRG